MAFFLLGRSIVVGAAHAASSSVQQTLTFVGGEDGKMPAMRQLLQRGLEPPVLIFVQSKSRAKELFNELVYENVHVDAIHADRTQQQVPRHAPHCELLVRMQASG